LPNIIFVHVLLLVLVNRKSRAIFSVRCASTDKPSNRHVKNAPGDDAASEKKRREKPQTVSLFAENEIENFDSV